MAFSKKEIDAEFKDETDKLPATARRIRGASWMTDVTAGEDGIPVGLIGPTNPKDEGQ
jgi:hypothetical protein